MISLDEYVENMKPDQKDIYYIAADSVTSAKNTPFLERLYEKDLEVCKLSVNTCCYSFHVCLLYKCSLAKTATHMGFSAGAILS